MERQHKPGPGPGNSEIPLDKMAGALPGTDAPAPAPADAGGGGDPFNNTTPA